MRTFPSTLNSNSGSKKYKNKLVSTATKDAHFICSLILFCSVLSFIVAYLSENRGTAFNCTRMCFSPCVSNLLPLGQVAGGKGFLGFLGWSWSQLLSYLNFPPCPAVRGSSSPTSSHYLCHGNTDSSSSCSTPPALIAGSPRGQSAPFLCPPPALAYDVSLWWICRSHKERRSPPT